GESETSAAAKTAGDQQEDCRRQIKTQNSGTKLTGPVILDLGTGYLKAGFAGEKKPLCVISSVIKKVREFPGNCKQSFAGKLLEKPEHDLIYPLKNGLVDDWDTLEELWKHVSEKELGIATEDHPVLVSEHPLTPTRSREKMAELMFETFSVPAVHMAYQPALLLYSYGKTSGLVLESGHGGSYVAAVYNGCHRPTTACVVDYGGQTLNAHLLRLLNESGQGIQDHSLNIVEEIKEKCCYVARDIDYELYLPESRYKVEYELPDGRIIFVGKERFTCPEALFHPNKMGSTEPGLPTLMMNCINKQDRRTRGELLRNIVIGGGSTMFMGFPKRLTQELGRLSLNSDVLIEAGFQRKHTVWIGGSILASLRSFHPLWVQKKEYDEKGVSALHRKC
uniref:Actin-3-like n=1 Tax=Lepisosteus oculatus TaxID=7918 RepID=W5NNF2_LEPOC